MLDDNNLRMKRMVMTMAMVVMMISSVSAKNMSNRPNFGKQPTCTCCKHGDCRYGDCKQDKCQPKQNPAFGGDRGNKPVTLPAPSGQRPVEIGRQHNANSSAFGKKNTKKSNKTNNTNIFKSSNKSFGNMKR